MQIVVLESKGAICTFLAKTDTVIILKTLQSVVFPLQIQLEHLKSYRVK